MALAMTAEDNNDDAVRAYIMSLFKDEPSMKKIRIAEATAGPTKETQFSASALKSILRRVKNTPSEN